jgi:peroxiredoxin
VGVHSNVDETLEQTQEYFKAQGLDFPVIQDDKTKTADAWKALKTPHVFVVSPEGNVLYKGGVSDSAKFENASKFYLREALEDLAQDRAVKTAQTRVLGCVIERGENADVWKK